MHFVLTCLLMVYFWLIFNSIHFFSFTCIHHLFHPSSYVNQLSQLDSFSTILNIAERDRLFSFISSSVGKIGLRVINLNVASKPSGTIGIPLGTGFGVDHFVNAVLHILSSRECNVITRTRPPIAITSAA